MKTKYLLIATILLLAVGCGHRKEESLKNVDDLALSNRIDSIGRAFTDSASVLRIIVMDSTGRLVVNSIVGDDGRATPNDEIVITPGELMFPIMLATLDEEVDTTSLMVRVGRKEYDNGCMIADTYVPIDPCTDLTCDSLPVMRAMEVHSHVAMTELGWMFYQNRRGLLKERISEMLPGVEFTSLCAESSTFESDFDFGSCCRGERMKVPLVSLMKCYLRNDVASFVRSGRIISWEAVEIDGKESDICIGYSPDRCYVALVIVSHNPMPSAFFDRIFCK